MGKVGLSLFPGMHNHRWSWLAKKITNWGRVSVTRRYESHTAIGKQSWEDAARYLP